MPGYMLMYALSCLALPYLTLPCLSILCYAMKCIAWTLENTMRMSWLGSYLRKISLIYILYLYAFYTALHIDT